MTSPWDLYKAGALAPDANRFLNRLEGQLGGCKTDVLEHAGRRVAAGAGRDEVTRADLKRVYDGAKERCMRCGADIGDCECPGGPAPLDGASEDHEVAKFVRGWAADEGLPKVATWEDPRPGERYADLFRRRLRKRLGQWSDEDEAASWAPYGLAMKRAAADDDWKNRPGVRAVVRDGDGLILLLKRPDSDAFKPGTWNLPGGAKEPDEGFRAGAARELREETGLTATPAPGRHVFTWPGGRGEAFLFIKPMGKLRLQKKEVAEARWFHPAKLPKPLFPNTAEIVKALTDGRATKAAAMKRDAQLKPHQHEAVAKLLANDGSLLVAHGTGSGKTITSNAAVEALRAAGKAHVTLAVTPAPLRDNYIENGVHKFTDQHAVRLGPKGERGSVHIDAARLPSASYYVVSNEMFRKDPHRYLDKTHADTIVWDEIHKARDKASDNYAAMMSVRPRVRNFIGLTGTPVNNAPHDIQPILDIVTNKHHGLGRNPKEFDQNFLTEATRTHGPLAFLGIGPRSTETRLAHTDRLRHELGKWVHYVPGSELAQDLPAKQLHDVPVEMSRHQQELYHFAMNKVDPITRWKIKMNLPVGSREAQHIFSRITQARQASNAVHTLDSHFDAASAAEATPKIHRLVEDVRHELEKGPHHKAIVYTNFVKGGVDAVAAGLRHRGIEPAFFLGSAHQKRTERSRHVADYLAGRKRVMIINSAGTEGLDLPGTTSHHTLDPHFNPAVLEQAEARGIRSGSPVDAVNVYRYKSVLPRGFGGFMPRETSADEWVQNTADRKDRLNQQFLDLMRRR